MCFACMLKPVRPQLTRNSKPTGMLRMDQDLTIRFGQQKTLATDMDYLY